MTTPSGQVTSVERGAPIISKVVRRGSAKRSTSALNPKSKAATKHLKQLVAAAASAGNQAIPPDLHLAAGLTPRWLLDQAPQRWMTVSGRPTPASVLATRTGANHFKGSSLASGSKAVKKRTGRALPATTSGTTTNTSGSKSAGPAPAKLNAGSGLSGNVSGVVTDSASGQPVPGVVVTAYSRTTYTQAPETAVTDAAGSYTLTGLPVDFYDLAFTDNAQGHLVQYSGEQPTTSTATPVDVTAGSNATGVDAQLIPGGSISGVVTSGSTGLPLTNVCVSAFTPQGTVVGGGCTDSTGRYQTTGLPNGSYEIEFIDNNNTYVPGWYGGSSRTAATPVTVSTGAVTSGIGDTMVLGGSVSGVVTAAESGTPLGSICVYAYGTSSSSASFCTDSTGTFDVTGLATGTYALWFYDQDLRYLGTAYTGPGGTSTVSVTTGSVTSGITQSLQLGGSISGTVTDASTGLPLAGICAYENNYYGYSPPVSQCSSSTGAFTLTGLASGSYYLSMVDPSGNYVTYQSSTTVAVVAPGTVSGIAVAVTLGGSISGTVEDAVSHAPLTGICVEAYGSSYRTDCTDASGNFQINGLATGSYQIYAYDNLGRYLEEVYGMSGSSGTPIEVPVTNGTTTTSIDPLMTAGGTVTGSIKAAGSNQPLAGICVYVSDSVSSGSSCSRIDGSYTVGGLGAGGAQVQFYDPSDQYVTQYYDNQSYSTATSVTIATGTTTSGIDAAMVLGGAVSGTVTAADTGQPLAGVCVSASGTLGFDGGGPWSCTDSTGYYRISGLPTDTVSVTYPAPPLSGYVSKTVSSLSVTAGQTTTSDVSLALGGVISGTVTSASTGLPLSNVEIGAFSTQGFSAYAVTDSSGNYTIIGLPSGSYTVGFAPPYGSAYILQWYDGQSSNSTATSIAVSAGNTYPHIDAAMQLGGSITGTLTSAATGLPVSGAWVYLYQPATGQGVASATSGTDGTYTLVGLATGSYDVEFGASGYQTQWYQNQTSYSSANPVSVTAGQTTAHIDGQLLLPATISGTVTDASSGSGVSLVHVTVFSGSIAVGSATTGPDGTYTVTGLAAGTYTVEFAGYSSSGYAAQWWNDVASQAAATPITLALGQTVAAVNASLQALGSITGTITDSSTGQPIAGVCVTVSPASDIGNAISTACSDATGAYHAIGIPTGTYLVAFADPAGNYSEQWFDAKADALSADPVEVITGSTTSNVDAAMSPAGKISGVVTDSSGQPIQGVCVYAYEATTFNEANGNCTDSTGTYVIGGLTPGSYDVEFAPYGSPYIGQWYDNSATSSTATAIAVTAGATQHANASLVTGGTVSGTVTDAATHAPLSGICVDVWDSAGYSSSGCTDSSGVYTTGGLPTGTYYVQFYDGSGRGYLTQYYNGQTDISQASTVAVHLGQNTAGIDAAMTQGGVLAGSVTDGSTSQPLAGICIDPYGTGGGGASYCSSLTTAGNGGYSVNLPAGQYTVSFLDPNHHYIAESMSATVTAGATTTLDAGLTAGGSISGVITDASNGAPLSAVCPILYAHDTQTQVLTSSACTATDGTYTIGGLAPGTYDLDLTNPNGRFIPQWYVNGGNEGSATPVTVGSLQAVTGIDAAMTLGGVITGTVRSSTTGLPLANVCVTIYQGSTSGVAATAGCTDKTGTYTSPGLPPGSYTVQFHDSTGTYPDQWYKDQANQSQAALVAVTSGNATTGIDASMATHSSGPGGTVALAKAKTVIGNATIQVSGSGWNANGDTTVTITECTGVSFSTASCDQAGEATAMLSTGKTAGAFKKVNLKVVVGEVGTGGQTCGVTGSGACYVVVVGNSGDSTASTALTFGAPTAALKVTTNVKSNAVDGLKASGFPAGDNVVAEECDSGATPVNLATSCDPATSVSGLASSKGKVALSAKGVTVLTGSAYSESGSGTCSPGGTCSIVVDDTTQPGVAVVVPITLAP